jgi:putative selenium metabolism hydrolase
MLESLQTGVLEMVAPAVAFLGGFNFEPFGKGVIPMSAGEQSMLDECRDDLIAFARKLVSIPRLTGEEKKVAEAICAEMGRLGFDEAGTDGTGNVIGVIRGSGGGEHIMYNCHMDHVSPGDPQVWEFPPYEAAINDGYLHGRGASDTKGAIAVQIYAVAAIKRYNIPHRGDILVTMVVEEEPGDMWGVIRMFSELPSGIRERTGLLVLGEATGLDVYLGHRGKVEVELEVRGKIAHSGTPRRGENAVYPMKPVIGEIERLGGELPKDDFLSDSSLAITNISCSPGWLSTIPDRCCITVDRRFLPREDSDSIMREMEGVPRRSGLEPGKNAEVKFKKYAHTSYTGVSETLPLYKTAFLTNRDEPHVAKTVGALRGVGQNPIFKCWSFGTDGAWVATRYGIPTIGYSPCEEQYAHTPRDRVSLELMEKSFAGYMGISRAISG